MKSQFWLRVLVWTLMEAKGSGYSFLGLILLHLRIWMTRGKVKSSEITTVCMRSFPLLEQSMMLISLQSLKLSLTTHASHTSTTSKEEMLMMQKIQRRKGKMPLLSLSTIWLKWTRFQSWVQWKWRTLQVRSITYNDKIFINSSVDTPSPYTKLVLPRATIYRNKDIIWTWIQRK